MQHATCEAQRARTHRPGVRDRAALERDGPVMHAHHAAVVLRTANAATPAAVGRAPRPPTPAPTAHPARLALSPRLVPARTNASVPDIATASNSAAPLAMASTPPWTCARAHRTAARPTAQARPFTHSRSARAQHAPHTTRQPCSVQRIAPPELPEGGAALTRADATRSARKCNAHRCNVQRMPMQGCNTRGSQRLSSNDTGMMCRNECEEEIVTAPQRATYDTTQPQVNSTHRSVCTAPRAPCIIAATCNMQHMATCNGSRTTRRLHHVVCPHHVAWSMCATRHKV